MTKILIADDEKLIRAGIRKMLSDALDETTGLRWFENKNALYLHVHLQKRT